MLFSVYLQGLSLGASLIIAIGAQNAFVLRQGVRREHGFAIATVCFLCDAVLIGIGCAGVGTLIAASFALKLTMTWAGAAYLLRFAYRSFRAAFKADSLQAGEGKRLTLQAAILATLGVSLLNPHVYLDTVVLLGGLSGRFAGDQRAVFAMGAITASFIWFYALALAARLLAPVLNKPRTWQIIDVAVGCVMLLLALILVRDGLKLLL